MTTATALVTGCSTGLGRALAAELLARDYTVIATSRNPDGLSLEHPNLHPVALDLDAPDSFPDQVQAWAEQHGSVRLLINNAGYGQMGPIMEVPWREMRQQLHTNAVAPLALTQALLPQLLETRGLVVNIGSVSAYLTTPFAGGYCASKSALHTLNDVMRRELAPFGVRVQCVMAGGIRSSFGATATEHLEQVFSETSRYRAVADKVRERAGLSQKNGADPAAVARDIIDTALHHPDRPYLATGSGARWLRTLSRLPQRVQDRLLRRRFGLDRL